MILLRDLKRAVARREAQLMALVLNKFCTGFCSCKTSIHAIHGNKRSKCMLQDAPCGAYRLVRARRYEFWSGPYMPSQEYILMACLDHEQACKPEASYT